MTNMESEQPSSSVVCGPDANDSPVVRAAIAAFTAASAAVVAADATRKIRVLSWFVMEDTGGTAETLQWLSGSTALSGIMKPTAGVPLVGAWNPHGHFETAINTALNLGKGSTTISCAGYLTYQLVKPVS